MYQVLNNQPPQGKACSQVQFEIVSMTFANLTAEQSRAGISLRDLLSPPFTLWEISNKARLDHLLG